MNHIQDERLRLGHNIEEIEDRIKGATDLKGYFDRNTGMFLGAALAAGVIASVAMRKGGQQRERFISNERQPMAFEAENVPREHSTGRRLADKHLDRISGTFDSIIDGLIGVACGKIVSLIGDAVPSFKSEYNVRHRDRSWSSLRTVNPNIPPDATKSR